MICPNCGMEHDNNEQVCSLCGYEFTENAEADMPLSRTESEVMNSRTVSAGKKPKKNSLMIVIIAVLVIIVIGLAAFVIKLAADKKTQPTVSVPEITETTQSDIIETTTSTETATTSTTVTTTVTTTTVTTTEAVTEPPQTGEDYLLAYGWRINEADILNPDSIYRDYTLFDIDGNGIYEIMMRMGNSEADACYKIWTIEGNTVVYCGDIGAGNTYLTEMDGKLYINAARMGYQHTEEITLIDNQIFTSVYYDSGSTMLEEYYTFGEYVDFCDFSDSSMLDTFSTAEYENGHYTSEIY